jgi:hypothetical protein
LHDFRQLGFALKCIQQKHSTAAWKIQAGRNFRRIGSLFFALFLFLRRFYDLGMQLTAGERVVVFLGGVPIDE